MYVLIYALGKWTPALNEAFGKQYSVYFMKDAHLVAAIKRHGAASILPRAEVLDQLPAYLAEKKFDSVLQFHNEET